MRGSLLVKPQDHSHIKPERLPWRSPVTLCLAAECKLGREQRIILAYDYEAENDMVGAEIQKKLMRIGNSHVALLAGSLHRAIEMVVVCEQFFASEKGSRLDTLDKLREAVSIQKKRLADEHVSGQLGISYDRFFQSGKEKLPDDLFREIAYEIKNMTLGCSLLIAKFFDGGPSIFRVHESGTVEICCNFAAVGTGMWLAESMLFLREHDDDVPLREGMYNVYEAMRLGARAPGVGAMASFMVVSEGDNSLEIKHVTPHYERYLEKQLAKFGPKGVGKLEFRPEFLEEM